MISTDIFVFERGKVNITDDGLDIPEIREFYDADKKHGKPKFSAYMKALYYMYSKGSPYYNMSVDDRIQRIENHHVGMRKWSVMMKDEQFKNIVDLYIMITTTKEERQFKIQMDNILKDIDNQIEKLNRISTVRKETVMIDYKKDDGTVEKREVYLEMINFDERNRAIKALKEAFDLQEYIKDKIKNHEIDVKTTKGYMPLFDDLNT